MTELLRANVNKSSGSLFLLPVATLTTDDAEQNFHKK